MATQRAPRHVPQHREAHRPHEGQRPSDTPRGRETGDRHAQHGHAEMLRQWIWRDFSNIVLGIWLIASPFTFGVEEAAVIWSDVVSGALIVVLGTLTLSPRFDLARWGLCATGLWLLFAPLVFWTAEPAAYANDTLVGALVIAFSVLVP